MNVLHDPTKQEESTLGKSLDETVAEKRGLPQRIRSTAKVDSVVEEPCDPITGIYGALRGLIDQAGTGIVVHVVAATQRESASTIAKAIADSAAIGGNGKVMLMDGKLPSRKLTGARRQDEGDPITGVGAGHVTLAYPVHIEGAVKGLAVGNIASAAHNEKVDPGEVRNAYAAWRKEYDLVIVDCPSVASGRYIDLVPDAADWVILVVQAERLRPEVLRKVRDTIEQQGGKILGVILKDAKYYIPKFIYRFI